MKTYLSYFIFSSVIFSSHVMAQDAGHLRPATDWRVDQVAGNCHISRSFGSVNNRIRIEAFSGASQAGISMSISGLPIGLVGDMESRQVIFHGPFGDVTREGTYISLGQPLIHMMISDPELLAALGDEASIQLAAQEESELIIGSPIIVDEVGLNSGITRVLECADELYRSWGFDPSVRRNMVSPPTVGEGVIRYITRATDQAAWEGVSDIDRRQRTQLRLSIGVDGKPTECVVMRSVGHNSLDQLACRVTMTGSQFVPARDASGQAIAAPMIFFIQYAKE